MAAAIQTLMLLLTYLNFLAAPVAIVWLLILKQWWAIALALVSLLSHFALGLALLPGLLLMIPAAAAGERNPRLASLLAVPHLLYVSALVVLWCMGVFTYLMSRATEQSWIPLLLLAYSIATAPWAYMASKETHAGDGSSAALAVLFAEVGVIIVALLFVLGIAPSQEVLWSVFALVMLVHVVAATLLGYGVAEAPFARRRHSQEALS